MINGAGSEILRRKVVSPLGRHLVAGVTVFRLCKTDLPENVQNERNIILCVFLLCFWSIGDSLQTLQDRPKSKHLIGQLDLALFDISI